MKTNFLQLKNVTVIRGKRKILNNINLVIDGDENVAVIGPNGSGKSTFIKLITGKIYPSYTGDDSVCKIFGKDRWNIGELRNLLGIVTNELQYEFYGYITGYETILSGFFASVGLFNNHCVTKEMKDKASEMADFLDISHLQNNKLETMSSGEVRRFFIARALVNNPKVLVLDEPSNSLDISSVAKLHDTMRKIVSTGTKIVMVTHQACDIIPEMKRFIYFKNGKIFADGLREEIFNENTRSSLFDMQVELIERNGLCNLNGKYK